jgi:hypothetical protein
MEKNEQGKRSDFTNYQKIYEKDSAFILKKKKISELKLTGSFQTLLEIGSAMHSQKLKINMYKEEI